MNSKRTPANLDLASNSDLSSLNLEVNSFLDKQFKAKTGRPAKLAFLQLLFCLELKKKYSCENWIGLYRCLLDRQKLEQLNLNLPSYCNFLKSIKKLIFYLLKLITYQVEINRIEFLKQEFKIAFTDSTPLAVCDIKRSSRHKVMENCNYPPNYSKSTVGWFYGYKLHLIIDWQTRKVISFQFSSSKLDDRQYLKYELTTNFLHSQTLFVADKGYQAKWLEELTKETGNYLITGKRKSKSMKTLASQFDIYLLHIRARIESVFSDLKQNCFLTNTRSRSVLGYLFNYFSSLYFLIFKVR